MRFSVGIDIVDIEKLRGSVARWGQKFVMRILTTYEYEYCRSKVNFLQSFAGRIACKEAVYKALYQHGISGLSWKDIEVREGPGHEPIAAFSQKIADVMSHFEVAISISHTDRHAVAIAHIEKSKG